jgi:membrane associated rhomboid family serine protease
MDASPAFPRLRPEPGQAAPPREGRRRKCTRPVTPEDAGWQGTHPQRARLPPMLIPIRDVNPTRRRPWLTLLLITANVILFLREPLFSPPAVRACFFWRWGAVPVELVRGLPLARPPFCAPTKDLLLSAVSSIFVHASFLHVLGNMLYLWVFGNNVEDALGRLGFSLLYLASGLAGLGLHTLANPTSRVAVVGASGAIAGLLGAYLVLFPRARILALAPIFFVIFPVEVPAAVLLLFWFVLQLLGALEPLGAEATTQVAYLVHVGGFVTGLLAGLIFRGTRRPPRRPSPTFPSELWDLDQGELPDEQDLGW